MPEEFSNKSAIWQQILWHQKQIEELRKLLCENPVAEEKSSAEE